MWWHKPRLTVCRVAPLATALALATLLAGCFEPLYGEKTLAGGPGLNRDDGLPFQRGTTSDPDTDARGATAGPDMGDANLDTHIDFSDLLLLAQHYGQSNPGLSINVGDVNLNGATDFDDLLALD